MFEQFFAGIAQLSEDPDDVTCMTVVIPGDIDPWERHHRFSVYLDAELRLAQLGCSIGGGTLFFERDEDDARDEIAYCILDVDAVEVDPARELIRLHMPELGIPAGTLLQWNGREDRFDGSIWSLNLPQSLDELEAPIPPPQTSSP